MKKNENNKNKTTIQKLENNNLAFPRAETNIEHSINILKALVNTVGAGGAFELFEEYFGTPLANRKTEWYNNLNLELKKAEKFREEFSPKNLEKNELFVSISLQATQIALRNHQEIKLKALRNAIFNCVLLKGIDDNKKQIFTQLIDSITPVHIKVIRKIENGINQNSNINSIFSSVFEKDPEFSKMLDKNFFELIIQDLSVKQLIKVKDKSINTHISGIIQNYDNIQASMLSDLYEERNSPVIPMILLEITELGREFIQFLLTPEIIKKKNENDVLS